MKRLLSFALFAAALAAGGALAQSYPARPVTFIVPFAAGGGTDITARTVAAKLTRIPKGGGLQALIDKDRERYGRIIRDKGLKAE